MKKIFFYLVLAIHLPFAVSYAQNPIIQTKYTADPAPMVYHNKIYLYTGHDEAGSTWFTMNDWRLYSSDDMVNWTEHRSPLSYKTFKWAKGDAWAAQCIERNGKFYMYVPVTDLQGKMGIGVAVADSPYGPFYDPLGKPLVQSGHGDIDPSVFIDDDGQAYLYWGNPNCYYVTLNEDMISYKEKDIVHIPMTKETFGKRDGSKERPTLYEEGPWLYKKNKLYYLLFAAGPLPEHIGYSTSNRPTGPWKYRGVLMPQEGRSFTNHPGLIDFRGNTYFFYHNGALPDGSGFTRSVCIEQIKFNTDGTIPPLKMSKTGIVKGISTLNPYIKTEAETIAWSEGITSSQNDQVGVFITATRNGAFTKVREVNFQDQGPTGLSVRVGTTHNAKVQMEVRLDSIDGKLLGTIHIPRTGGNDRWDLVSTEVKEVTGIHDLFFVFKGSAASDLAYFDYWRFIK